MHSGPGVVEGETGPIGSPRNEAIRTLVTATLVVIFCSNEWLDLAPEWGSEVYFHVRREFAFRDPDGYLIICTNNKLTDDPPTSLDE